MDKEFSELEISEHYEKVGHSLGWTIKVSRLSYLKAIFEFSMDAILVSDGNGRCVDANPAASELLGYSQQEFSRLNILDLTFITNSGFSRDVRSEGVQRGECILFRKDGRCVEVEYRTLANVTPGFNLTIFRDLTETKQAREAERIASVQAEILRQSMADLAAELELEQGLHNILDKLALIIPSDSSLLLLAEADHLRVAAAKGYLDSRPVVGQRYPSDSLLFQIMRRTGNPVILIDAQTEPHFRHWGGEEYVRGWMGVPLIARHELIGYLTIESRQVGAYGSEEARLAQAFGNEAAIAIVNVQLFKLKQELATTDSLTGLCNRRHFFELAEGEFLRAPRLWDSLSIIMLDIDHFKNFNDSHGHAVGDRLLIEVAKCCRHETREKDILSRLGGDEFIILLPETSKPNALKVANRLRHCISRAEIEVEGGLAFATVSLGVASLDADCASLSEFIKRVDKALYLAKENGRNQVRVWQG